MYFDVYNDGLNITFIYKTKHTENIHVSPFTNAD